MSQPSRQEVRLVGELSGQVFVDDIIQSPIGDGLLFGANAYRLLATGLFPSPRCRRARDRRRAIAKVLLERGMVWPTRWGVFGAEPLRIRSRQIGTGYFPMMSG